MGHLPKAQRGQRYRCHFTTIEAPAGLPVAENIQYLADQVMAAAMRHSLTTPRWKREERSRIGRMILQGDPGIRFWFFVEGSNGGLPDYRCVVHRNSHWFPLAFNVHTCEQRRDQIAHHQAIEEAMEDM